MNDLDYVPSDQEVENAMKDFYAEIIPKADSAIEIQDEEPISIPLSSAQ